MTRRAKETAGCIVRKTPRGVIPVSAFDQEQMMADAIGTEYKLVKMTKRSLPQQRTYWKALSLVVANDERWATPEHLHDALKRACGFVTVVHGMNGTPFVTADSTAFDAMDADGFRAFMDKAMAKLAETIGWDPLGFLEGAGSMTRRKSFSKKERARLFSLYEGRCHLCTAKIDSTVEAYEIEHVIPWALTQDDSDENLRLAHVKCHKVKTHGDERTMLNKVERMRMKHLGHHPKSKNPIRSRPFANARTNP